MTIIELLPSKSFKGGWEACEAPGVAPAFIEPDAKERALNYARNRFGGRAGEIHVYDAAGMSIEEKIVIDGRDPL